MSKHDYYVSAVKYNSDDTHIAEIRIHPTNKDGQFSSTTWETKSRAEIVKLIQSGKSLCTITKNGDKWRAGAPLQVLPVTTDYVKTVADKTTKDNLENLPKF